MKDDLDRLMEQRQLDAVLVSGPGGHNPAMVYFTGVAHLTHADLLKPRGRPPVLLHASMERDEAARSGLELKDREAYDPIGLLQAAGGDRVEAAAQLLARWFEQVGVRGRVGVSGRIDAGTALAVLQRLEALLPDVQIVGEFEADSSITRARATKSPEEVERIRQMGRIATGVMGEVATYLTSHQAHRGVLVNREGAPLTVGEVKRRINLWLAMRGAENPEATIFAIGRDAGVPHSVGNDDDHLEVGKPIVFDFFPCEAGGGFFYDVTRTWCLGHAPDAVQEQYEHVRQAHAQAIAALRPGALCREIQRATCAHFAARGHATVMEQPGTTEGYTHSLGHGVGLAIHEAPWFNHLDSNTDTLEPGAVFTIEPGLYYPERGLGVRLEDTLWLRPDGTPEVLAELSLDLVLKLPGG